MERFKATEKELKTKAYSKEGLQMSGKVDPREQQKAQTADWLNNMVDKLSEQIDRLEAEAETLQMTKRGRKNDRNSERLKGIEKSVDKDKWHIEKLELVLRVLENGRLDPESVSLVILRFRWKV